MKVIPYPSKSKTYKSVRRQSARKQKAKSAKPETEIVSKIPVGS